MIVSGEHFHPECGMPRVFKIPPPTPQPPGEVPAVLALFQQARLRVPAVLALFQQARLSLRLQEIAALRARCEHAEALLTELPCDSCGGDCGRNDPDGFTCRGCGKIICTECVTVFRHFDGGEHGSGNPADAIAALRAQLAEAEVIVRLVDEPGIDAMRRLVAAVGHYLARYPEPVR